MPSERRNYFLRNLPAHLHGAGQEAALERLLTTYHFLREKLGYPGPGALVADYDLVPDGSPLRLVQDALRLALQSLVRDPGQLDSQLLGRLPGGSDQAESINRLLAEARRGEAGTRLLPKTHSLSLAGGVLVQNIAARTLRGSALAVTPDGQRVIAGGLGHSVKVWEIESGRLLWTLTGHLDPVHAVAVIEDGRRAVSGSWDGMLGLWDLEGGRLEKMLIGRGGRIECLAVTPDGHTAVAGMEDGALEVWDLQAGLPVRELRGHSTQVLALAIDQHGRHAISSAEDASLLSWDLMTGSFQVLAGQRGPVSRLSMTRDGRRAFGACKDKTFRSWDLSSGQEIECLRSPDFLLALALSADERYVVSGSSAGLRVWDLNTPDEALAIPTDSCNAVVFLPDGVRVLSSSLLRVWNLDRARQLQEPLSFTSGGILALTADDRRIVHGTGRGDIEIWDVTSCQKIQTLRGHRVSIEAVAVTPDGRFAVSGSRDGVIKIWDLDHGAELRSLPSASGGVAGLAIVKDGQRLVTGERHGELRGWSFPDGEEIASWLLPPGYLTALGVSPDSRYAVVGLHLEEDEEPNRVWDLKEGQEVRVLHGHPEAIEAVVITRDSRMAITGSLDSTLRVWDLETGHELRRIDAFDHTARGLAVSSDGHLLASASDDRTVRNLEPRHRRAPGHLQR